MGLVQTLISIVSCNGSNREPECGHPSQISFKKTATSSALQSQSLGLGYSCGYGSNDIKAGEARARAILTKHSTPRGSPKAKPSSLSRRRTRLGCMQQFRQSEHVVFQESKYAETEFKKPQQLMRLETQEINACRNSRPVWNFQHQKYHRSANVLLLFNKPALHQQSFPSPQFGMETIAPPALAKIQSGSCSIQSTGSPLGRGPRQMQSIQDQEKITLEDMLGLVGVCV